MILTSAILNEAEGWLDCRETSTNRSKCVDRIHEQFREGSTGSRDAWCAKFVWSITDTAAKKLGVANPLFKSASTAQMLKNTNLRKDKTPAKGSVFYTSRTGGGHVGFVEKVNGNIISTIEGNTSVGSAEGVHRKTHDIRKKEFTFIHVEDLDTIENNINSVLEPLNLSLDDKKLWIATGLIGASAVGVVLYRKFH
jgi:hypothetical protein